MLRGVRPSGRLALLFAVVVVVSWAGCGGTSIDGTLGPTGGSVCLPDNKVCINVPIGALETQEVLRISPGSDSPGGALSDAYDISGGSGRPVVFVKAATVTFSLDIVREGNLENENLLRIYTRERLDGGALGDWQPLANAFVDRVRREVRGETLHLSPFVVLRSDRLVDGGLPVEIDGGPRDAAVIVEPYFDGGRVDAGRPDAGRPDAGRADAGPIDAGMMDAGPRDAGPPDAGPPDAGPPDAGPPDAGPPDAGPADAGPPDAGPPDAGAPDAGPPDAGLVDGGLDGGDGG